MGQFYKTGSPAHQRDQAMQAAAAAAAGGRRGGRKPREGVWRRKKAGYTPWLEMVGTTKWRESDDAPERTVPYTAMIEFGSDGRRENTYTAKIFVVVDDEEIEVPMPAEAYGPRLYEVKQCVDDELRNGLQGRESW